MYGGAGVILPEQYSGTGAKGMYGGTGAILPEQYGSAGAKGMYGGAGAILPEQFGGAGATGMYRANAEKSYDDPKEHSARERNLKKTRPTPAPLPTADAGKICCSYIGLRTSQQCEHLFQQMCKSSVSINM